MDGHRHGIIDHWLQPIRDTADSREEELTRIADPDTRLNRLCEMSIEAQVEGLSRTPIIQSAWKRGKDLAIHGWVYGLNDGLLARPGMRLWRQGQGGVKRTTVRKATNYLSTICYSAFPVIEQRIELLDGAGLAGGFCRAASVACAEISGQCRICAACSFECPRRRFQTPARGVTLRTGPNRSSVLRRTQLVISLNSASVRPRIGLGEGHEVFAVPDREGEIRVKVGPPAMTPAVRRS